MRPAAPIQARNAGMSVVAISWDESQRQTCQSDAEHGSVKPIETLNARGVLPIWLSGIVAALWRNLGRDLCHSKSSAGSANPPGNRIRRPQRSPEYSSTLFSASLRAAVTGTSCKTLYNATNAQHPSIRRTPPGRRLRFDPSQSLLLLCTQ